MARQTSIECYRKGIGSHQSAAMLKDEWLTPPSIIEALGAFDLDPCSPIDRPWNTADRHYTIEDNGLLLPWDGRVWCNPPYGKEIGDWMMKCALHGDTICLTFARTETAWFFDTVWPYASGIFFFKGRLHFHHVTGERAKANSGAPSVLIAYGNRNAETLKRINLRGQYVPLSNGR